MKKRKIILRKINSNKNKKISLFQEHLKNLKIIFEEKQAELIFNEYLLF